MRRGIDTIDKHITVQSSFKRPAKRRWFPPIPACGCVTGRGRFVPILIPRRLCFVLFQCPSLCHSGVDFAVSPPTPLTIGSHLWRSSLRSFYYGPLQPSPTLATSSLVLIALGLVELEYWILDDGYSVLHTGIRLLQV